MGYPTESTEEAATETTEIPRFYPIGTPGKPWTDDERNEWKATRKYHRSYKEEVLNKFDKIGSSSNDVLEVVQYGALSHDPQRYPLYVVKSKNWQENKPTLLVTGGVHGYETSGVQGAILFLETQAANYTEQVNILVAPCVSPWAYEHIERWNADLKDPNRSFKKGNETEESAALISYIESLNVKEWACHVDLHETTDTDKSEFRPAKHAEAGSIYKDGIIPDGFYLVGDSKDPQLEFLQAIIDGVEKVTHIAPERIICDEPVVRDGIILFPTETLGLCGSLSLGLCRGLTGGKYATTTEVYPDSPRATDAICNAAQVAAVVAALDFVLSIKSTEIPRFYPIGIPGKPWTDDDRNEWKATRKYHRSYKEEVLTKLDKISSNDVLEVVQYGALSHDPQRYPLYVVKSKNWQENKPTLLVTGGVHGYETSGVQGAILFLETQAANYTEQVNILVAPCVSPWAYEHIERWNADLKDPNRSFKKGNETEESAALISYIESLNVKEWACHLDLHETTDTDETEFMPAKHAEAGLSYSGEVIPDGFYLVGDSEVPQLEFQKAIISGVEKVTHIVTDDTIIDEPAVSNGVILVPSVSLGLCGSLSLGLCRDVNGGSFATTTEVYPDSPRATDEICNAAQVAAIVAGIEHVLGQQRK